MADQPERVKGSIGDLPQPVEELAEDQAEAAAGGFDFKKIPPSDLIMKQSPTFDPVARSSEMKISE